MLMQTTVHPGRSRVSTLCARRIQARSAADWLRSWMTAPPVTMAARRFQTTPYLVKRELESRLAIDALWDTMTMTERGQFMDRNFTADDLWGTSPASTI